jgi:hypothetical protein
MMKKYFRKWLNPEGRAHIESSGYDLNIGDCGRTIYLEFDTPYSYIQEKLTPSQLRAVRAAHKANLKKLGIIREALDFVEDTLPNGYNEMQERQHGTKK